MSSYRTLLDDLRAPPVVRDLGRRVRRLGDRELPTRFSGLSRSEQAGAGGGNLCLRIAGGGHDARCCAPAARRARGGARFFDGRGGMPHRSRPCWCATGSSCRSSAPSCAPAMASRSESRTPVGSVGTFWSLRSTPRTRSTGYYPAYVDSSTNPEAIELERSDDPHLLAEVVEPEHPAEGPLRVVAAVSSEPMTVRAVERELEAGRDVGALSPQAQVTEWSCTWGSR